MDTKEIEDWLADYVTHAPTNQIEASYALTPDIAGTPLFDTPLVGCAAADDPLFERMQADESILGPTLRLPTDWLPEAKSVISIFYPFSRRVCESNYGNLGVPSDEWLHGRVEGHDFIHATDKLLAERLRNQGFKTIIPAIDPGLVIENRLSYYKPGTPPFVSSWSERHVAFAAGLGTFGLSVHLITAKGVSGRFGSIITDAEIEPTPRPYGDDPYAYCISCGACAAMCPVDALDLKTGKDFQTCWEYMEETKIRFKPRYGCGKCQLTVPCEKGIPKRAQRSNVVS